MSGFDENPFGEPNINDPFSDPAIKRAVASTPASRGLEDYNPFAEQGTQGTGQVRGAANPPIYDGIGTTQQPATLFPSVPKTPPPPYAPTRPTVNETEPELKASTEDMRNTLYYPKRNNWPPLPDKCCFQPCFYQDIEVEIQSEFQKVVRQLYRLWMFHGCVLVLNVIGGFILILCNEKFSTFGLGILFLILFTPFSFLCWFRPAYRAFKNDSSFNFMVFFFVFFFQLIVTAIQAIGIPGFGTCGIITAITMFDSSVKGIFVGLVLLFVAFCFVLAACGDFLLLTKIHRIYRSLDAVSMSKAQQEFATTFLRNEHVQNVASDVGERAVRAQMANAANQPRY
ncbi:secretory carrier-associated membrane protein 5 [Colletes gigas]|uniref:secretory carrier-associated membrane protein 5 n=1 Tax=Colletes gigas TaxID=935657 RepID=UPI001C9B4F65|nr:secretory carrier-associated membrane protein 5 [Colletes gigas]XP_043257621.1 secretory carrier-associated membrane protein 5 [Colletes gigas]XP_043257622.1 secretory carrier-associated membrane protein 5 [Colletes gigas]XP_043257623.1 secretory carrier-associated membrane protein 5 [Colletes gigas]XP_043257624.1 secretory carrier-associated membrane protein 5 [Colletes gigas]